MNESFKTVLTADDFTEPNRTLDCQGLQEIAVHKKDIGSLQDKLEVRKAMGPDGVSGWGLRGPSALKKTNSKFYEVKM
ncbi:hypothetical protein E2C01_088399 [Portunus trituberculatus]|uniref:Uncharacterized protein n=1 Tax=Portunus trituberculatus TaxID=210409 RepID=A0A5B7JFA7_PORTR|nr:hypothetical protein [Portunus trituberculatus]